MDERPDRCQGARRHGQLLQNTGRDDDAKRNVIDMTKTGVAEENIVLAIDNAGSTEFDLSPNGLIALSKGGVSKNVIAHLQKRTKR